MSSSSKQQTCLGFQGCPMQFGRNLPLAALLLRRRGKHPSTEFSDDQWNSAEGALNFKANKLPSS